MRNVFTIISMAAVAASILMLPGIGTVVSRYIYIE